MNARLSVAAHSPRSVDPLPGPRARRAAARSLRSSRAEAAGAPRGDSVAPAAPSDVPAAPSDATASSVASVDRERQARRELEAAMRVGQAALRAHALRLTGRPADADDVVQETMIRALRFAASYEPGTNPRAWLARVLHSVFITQCRRRTRERRALEGMRHDPAVWRPETPAPELRTLTPAVQRALEALPERFAAVLRLVDLDEQSYRDAADALGVPIGTVMSRLHRARRLLADMLGPSTGGRASSASTPHSCDLGAAA